MATNTRPILLAGVLLLLLAAGLAGCGAASESGYVAPPEMQAAVGREAPAPSTGNQAAGSAADADSGQPQIDRMIIWTADISLTVEDTQAALDRVHAIARQLSGYAIGSESWLVDDQLLARITFRVPASRFEEAMAQLRDLAIKVNRESTSSEDVTDEYVDLESRLRHLETKELQLLEFLDQAEDTEAVLAVYEHLAETQAEIEQVKGRKAYLETLSAMATIRVDLQPEEPEPPVVEPGWKPGRTLRDAARSLVSTLQGFGNAAIWFGIYLLPILLLIALPVAGVIWLLRRNRRHRPRGGADQVDE